MTVKIQSSDADLLAEAEKTARTALVGSVKIIESMDAKQVFGVSSDDTGTLYLFMNGERIATDTLKKRFFKFFNGLLRLAVAEHAPNRVFVHAGVVGWKGKAIIIPAKSFGGKTTLVAEFVRKGAEYYSDEYAVFDEKGLVHPFPRDLSVRDNSFKERDIPVAEFGGIAGTEPIPVGAVIITEFEEKGEWLPRKLTVGQGIMELIPHTIPRNVNTKFALKVLNTAVSDAIILKSHRGEANDIALNLLSIY
ncbi:MAG: hypothetical protein DMF63_18440 [Acidobacteria bacterium]|nr:MAG: hypothetical protein DMF63_18440 [Acidobacteriota bacterium]